MMEAKYAGKKKEIFNHNQTLVEKLMTMCALKDLAKTICLHGLYPTLKDNMQQIHPELHQIVQAATANNFAIITKKNQVQFKKILDNNDYGWDTGGMHEVTARTSSWIRKDDGASRSALSIMVLFWFISFRQNTLENLQWGVINDTDKLVVYFMNHFKGGNFFPLTRNPNHKNDVLRFGGTQADSRCKYLSDMQLLHNTIPAFAHTTLKPLTNTSNQPVKIKGHTPEPMTYAPLYCFETNLPRELTIIFTKKTPAKNKQNQAETVSTLSQDFSVDCDICCSETNRHFLIHKEPKKTDERVSNESIVCAKL